MGVEPEYSWPGVTYRKIRLLEEVPVSYPFRSRIFRSTFDLQGFAFCDRIELYCVAEPGCRALIIDTGHRDLCGTEALDAISDRLRVPWDRTEVFLSHFHDDHDGNLLYCVEQGAAKLYSGATCSEDALLMERFLSQTASNDLEGEAASHFIRLVASGKKAQRETQQQRIMLHGGEVIPIAGYEFEVLSTPGHTFNHLCLLDRKNRILFAGDHICYAPPGCMQFAMDQHLVKRYLESLSELKSMNLESVYMCHHNPLLKPFEINRFISMLEGRYETLVIRAKDLFKDDDVLTVREAASIAARHYPKGLEGFPVSTRISRIATVFGTLDYLFDLNLLDRSIDDEGALVYRRRW